MKSLENLIPTPIAEAIGGTLMHSLWQLAALALLLMLVLALVPQGAARLRYWLAASTLGLMLLLPIATMGYLYEPPAEATTVAGVTGIAGTSLMAQAFTQSAPIAAVKSGVAEQISTFFEENAYLLLGCWLLGVVLLSLRFLGSCWQVHRLRHVGTEEVPQALASRFVNLLDQLGIRRMVRLRYSRLVDTPMVIGALKPVVLLPMGLMSGLSMEQVECILIHELGHVRRWDFLLNMVQSVAEIILFYHPATWWVTRQIRQERENCCDELVVGMAANKVQYARALLNLEVMRQQQPSLAMASQGGDLASRIRRITGGTVPPKRQFHARSLVFGLLTLACVVLLASQSHTVVKAALPFWEDDQSTPVPVSDSASTATTAVLGETPAHSPTFSEATSPALALGRMLPFMQHLGISVTCQDSPITKIAMTVNGDEIELRFNDAGAVVAGTRNGVAIPDTELGHYQAMASNFFRGGSTLDPLSPPDALSPMPPFPPMPDMQGFPGFPSMPSLPPFPDMATMPPMPPMPPMGEPGAEGFDHEAFERQMEDFGKQMERWGDEFSKQFEGADWQQYSKEMERWGTEYAKQFEEANRQHMERNGGRPGAGPSREYMELHRELDRLHADLDRAKGKRERAELENAIADLEDGLADLHASEMEEGMAEWEAQMEVWGERYAESMERMAAMQQERMEEMQRQMELQQERMIAEAERRAEQADRMAEEANRRETAEADRMAEEANRRETAEADRMAAEAEREGERAERASKVIGEALVDDGLISDADSYKLKINADELYIDGKKQSAALHRKYSSLVAEWLGISLDADWVSIHHNAR
jgi:bla regulator protein BlaR1